MKKKINLPILITSIVLACAIIALVTTVTLAVWQERPTGQKDVDVEIDSYNPSLRYIVFRGLDADGNLLADGGTAVAYAAVGYKGSVQEVIIPAEYNGKPVTQIAVSNYGTDFQYRFADQATITSLTVPASVTEIKIGACQGMSALKKIILLEGDSELTLGAFCFGDCPQLTDFVTNGRPVSGSDSGVDF